MRFDRSLGRAKVGPGEQRQAQVDGGRVHGIERFFQTQANVLVPIEFEGHGNQPVPKRLEQAPVAPFVGIGQGGAGYLAVDTDVVELGFLGVEASNQIA